METLTEYPKLFIPFIAIVGAYIAWQQYQTNRTKLRLDLFDKRFDIYNAVMSTLDDLLCSSDDISEEDYRSLIKAVNEAEFLLPEKVLSELLKVKELVTLVKIKQGAVRRISSAKIKRGNFEQEIEDYNSALEALECELEDLQPKITAAFKSIMKFEKF